MILPLGKNQKVFYHEHCLFSTKFNIIVFMRLLLCSCFLFPLQLEIKNEKIRFGSYIEEDGKRGKTKHEYNGIPWSQ